MAATVDLDWTFTLPASAWEVWRVFADTDGFNRTAGLDFHFQRVDGAMRGSTVVAGVKTEWIENPIVWESPKRFASERVYASGPIARAAAGCLLVEKDGETSVQYRIKLTPRNRFLRLPVQLIARTLIRPGLNKALAAARQAACGDRSGFDAPPPLNPMQREELEGGLAPIESAVADAIRQRILHAPLREQYRIRPLQIAAETGLRAEDVVRECVLAATSGALRLEVQVLCPRCRGGQRIGMGIPIDASGLHCETCDIRFDSNLTDNVEVVFAPGSSVRSDGVSIDCVFSPMRTPHIAAQVTLQPGSSCRWETVLEPGGYRLECGEREVWIVASEDCDQREIQFDLGPRTFAPRGLRVAPGKVEFRARNQTEKRATVSLQSRWLPPYALRISQLFELPTVREVLPEGLVAGVDARVEPGVIAVIEGDGRTVQRALQQVDSAHQLLGRSRALILFPTVLEALEEAERLASHRLNLNMAMAVGGVLVLRRGGHTRWTGPVVHEAMRTSSSLGRPSFALGPDALRDREVSDALHHFGDRVQLASRKEAAQKLAFATWFERPKTTGKLMVKQVEGAIPERIGRFTVLREMDRGGMGQVFEVEDPRGKRFALKRALRKDDDACIAQLFHKEAYYASTLLHPNLIEVVDWGDDDGRPFLVMEFLTGESLLSLLKKRRRLTLEELLPPLHGVLDGLEAAHEAGLVHRDVKPGNVFLLAQPTEVPYATKLLDYGLMRRSGQENDALMLGSPAYMAPEQMLRDVQDPRTDVFAVGALAYRALAGSPAWRGETLAERMIQRVAADPAELPWERVDRRVVEVIQRAIQPDPDARFPDVASLRAALP